MEVQNFINFLTALFLPPAVVPVRGREVWVRVPSSLAVAHGRGCHSAAIAPRLNSILPRGGTGQAHEQPSLDGGGKRGEGNQPLGAMGWGGVGFCLLQPGPGLFAVPVPEFVIATSTELCGLDGQNHLSVRHSAGRHNVSSTLLTR